MTLKTAEVPIQLIDIEPADHDSRSDTGNVRELMASIESVGLLEPVGLRPIGERYRVIYGFRRIAALGRLGWRCIPAVLVEGDQTDDALKSLVENVQRKQLSRQERADALERLARTGLSARDIAERVGLNVNVVMAWLRVSRSPALMHALRSGQIGIHHARQMASLPDEMVAALLPELEAKSQQWTQARIARAVDDERKRPPYGSFKKNAESHTLRSLEMILELMRGVQQVRVEAEVGVLRDILTVAAQWQRDLLRVKTAPP